MKKITLHDDSYWKLVALKAHFRCHTWKDLIEILYRTHTNTQ